MKLICLGVGSALDYNYHSNYLLDLSPNYDKSSIAKSYLAVDMGSTWPFALRDIGIDVKNIDKVFISHLHADHVGGLEWFAFTKYFKESGFLKKTISPTLITSTELLDELWNNTLKGGLESIQGQRNNLETYFKIKSLPPNGHFKLLCDDIFIKFNLVQTVHVIDDRRIKPSLGLMFDTGKNTVFITGDTQFCPNQILTYYQNSTLIIQDCELATYSNSVHAQYHQLCTLPEDIKRRMWLTHYSGKIPLDWESQGFRGFLKQGQELEI